MPSGVSIASCSEALFVVCFRDVHSVLFRNLGKVKDALLQHSCSTSSSSGTQVDGLPPAAHDSQSCIASLKLKLVQ